MEVRMEQYRVFNAAAQSSSVSQAAQKLYMTQSAVSQSIKQLETALDTKLFIRTPRGISLTHEGAILYEYTSSALDLLETGSRRLSAFHDLSDGELRIGASDTVSAHYLIPLLEEYHGLYPNIRIKVINRVTTQAVELLKGGHIDLAFGNMPIVDDSLEIIECLRVHDIFVAGNGFSHLKSRAYSRREIADLPLILLEKMSNSRNYVDSVFARSGVTLSAAIELGAHELLLSFSCINLGVSCVIKEFSQKYLNDGSVFEVRQKTPIPERAVACCYSRHITLSAAAARFVEMVDTHTSI